MIKRFLGLILFFGMLFSLAGVSAVSYNVTNWTTLDAMRNDLTGDYTLLNDLTTSMSDYDTYASSLANSGEGWDPVGDGTTKFSGTFDGQNHTIDGLFIDRGGTNFVGLFGGITGTGMIVSNLGLTNVNITGGSPTGALVGYHNSGSGLHIQRVFSTGTVSGTTNVGGIVGNGYQAGTVEDVYSTANVSGNSGVGGILGSGGFTSGYLRVFSTGTITASTTNAGGLVGSGAYGAATTNCFFSGSVNDGSAHGAILGNALSSAQLNTFWNNNSLNPDSCVGAGSPSGTCTAIQDNESYFYDVSNEPMASWDFTNIWSDYNDGVTFPILQGFEYSPSITVSSPTSGAYYDGTVPVNFSAKLNGIDVDETWYYNGTGNTTYTSALNETLTDGDYSFVFYSNNTRGNLTTQEISFTVDTTLPSIEYSTGMESDGTNISQDWIYVNVTLDEINLANITYSLYNSTGLENQTIYTTNTSTTINWTGLADGAYTYNVTVTDLAGNTNLTGTRTITLDTASPTFSNIAINYISDINNSIDPGSVVTVTLNVSDSFLGVSDVILQTYNGTTWLSNITMTNLTSNMSNSEWTANITTQGTDATYTFNILANDTVGNVDTSANTVFYSYWDCTWNVSTNDLGTTGGFEGEFALGNVTITNTGDSEYSDNNCSITFGKTTSEGSWFFFENFTLSYMNGDFSSTNNAVGLNYSHNGSKINLLRVNASESKILEISAMYPSIAGTLTEYPSFPIAASITDTESGTSIETINAKMVITPGAFLETSIDSPTIQAYNLTPQNITFTAYVNDVVSGTDGVNNTAYNVSFNWTLPDDISSRRLNTSENLTFFNETLNDTSKQYLNFTLELKNDSTLDNLGLSYDLYVYAEGYSNSTGILTQLDQGVISDLFSLSFECYNEAKDGRCPDVCTYVETAVESYDPDCSAPASESGSSSSSSSSGGGGGGGGSSGDVFAKSEAEFELLRGEEQEFILTIENKFNNPKENIYLQVSGINSEYITIYPNLIDRIPANSAKNITVMITSPAYFTQGKYLLEFTIRGDVVGLSTTNTYSEKKYVTLYIVEVTQDLAREYLDEATRMISDLEKEGFNLVDFQNYLSLSEDAFENVGYLIVEENFKEMEKIYNSAFESRKILEELYEGLDWAEVRGIDVLETKKLIYTAEAIYSRGDYVLALQSLRQAQTQFALDTKGEFNLLYEIKANPGESAGVLAAFLTFGALGAYATRTQIYKKRLKLLNKEEKLILQLMRVVQEDTFDKNKMSMEEYGEAMNQYERKLGKVIGSKITIETKLANLRKFKGRQKALEQEKERLISLIKEVQTEYMEEGKIEARVYDNMFKTYSHRLSKVDEELIFLEAKEFLKGKKVPKNKSLRGKK